MQRHRSLRLVRVAALAALLAAGAIVVPAAGTDRVVVVRPGDTLSEIAVRQGVTVRQLMTLNSIEDPNRIFPGQRLRISAAAPAAPAPAGPATAPAAKPTVHVVRAGEHLTGISRRYGTTIAAIVAANRIKNPSYLRVGQRLTIPGAAATSPATPAAPAATTPASTVHVVGAGETLSGIAHRYRTTVDALARANGIKDPSYVRTGQRLTIPGTTLTLGLGARMPARMADLVAARRRIGEIIVAEATAQGVPAAFALAVAWQESGWQAGAVSSAGAVGVMQLTRPTADWVSRTMLHEPIHLTDARSNVRAGVRLLKHYLARYHNDKALVLAAYYQGQTAADRHGIYRITRPYIAAILALESYFAR